MSNLIPSDAKGMGGVRTGGGSTGSVQLSRVGSNGGNSSKGEIDGRVDQLALVQQTILNGATPTMIAGFAMIIAQIQSQAAHPDVLLTITSSIGSLERSASFRDSTWHGYDLTHDLIDPRPHMVYGKPTRPPMDQERSLRVSPATMQPQTYVPLVLVGAVSGARCREF